MLTAAGGARGQVDGDTGHIVGLAEGPARKYQGST